MLCSIGREQRHEVPFTLDADEPLLIAGGGGAGEGLIGGCEFGLPPKASKLV